LKFIISAFLLSILISYNSGSQEIKTNDDNLNLIDRGRKIENSIFLYTSRAKYETIKTITGEKISAKTEALIINGDTLDPEEINTRGQTTLNFRRKSFSFNLKSKASFIHGEKKESFKKFFALSLCMDKDYINNRLAFEMMEVLQIFDLFYSFCELRINDHCEGIYLVIERPEDWAIKKKDSQILIRRGYNQNIEKIETDKKIEKDEIRKYCEKYHQIYRYLNRYKGEELYKMVSDLLDLDVYMRWLAFNFLVRNGDYTDEVYFYYEPGIEKFSIIPWDYDDLFFSAPHEGNIEIKDKIGNNLIFSAEDLLDKKIASDSFLYKVYLVQFRDVLNRLPDEVLKRVFENTYSELYPYFSNDEIVKMSEFDAYHVTNQAKLKSDMLLLYNKLKYARDRYLNYLNNIPDNR
jgi:spore coat protein H